MQLLLGLAIASCNLKVNAIVGAVNALEQEKTLYQNDAPRVAQINQEQTRLLAGLSPKDIERSQLAEADAAFVGDLLLIGQTPQLISSLARSSTLSRIAGQPASTSVAVVDTQAFSSAYSKAPAAKLEIDQLADTIVKDFGGQVAKAPIKSEARALEKIITEYSGDISQIKDLARNTIITDGGNIAAITEKLEASGAKVKILSSTTNELGYSGINTTVKTKSGLTAEIQVNTPEMIYGKETEAIARSLLGDAKYAEISNRVGVPGGQGHVLYEQWRSLNPNTPEAQRIAAQSRAYYDVVRGGKNGAK